MLRRTGRFTVMDLAFDPENAVDRRLGSDMHPLVGEQRQDLLWTLGSVLFGIHDIEHICSLLIAEGILRPGLRSGALVIIDLVHSPAL